VRLSCGSTATDIEGIEALISFHRILSLSLNTLLTACLVIADHSIAVAIDLIVLIVLIVCRVASCPKQFWNKAKGGFRLFQLSLSTHSHRPHNLAFSFCVQNQDCTARYSILPSDSAEFFPPWTGLYLSPSISTRNASRIPHLPSQPAQQLSGSCSCRFDVPMCLDPDPSPLLQGQQKQSSIFAAKRNGPEFNLARPFASVLSFGVG
jgi:hypothetical protein